MAGFTQLTRLSVSIAIPCHTRAKAEKVAADFKDALLSSRPRSFLRKETFSMPKRIPVEPSRLGFFAGFDVGFAMLTTRLDE